jgi:hypothetical protein
MNFQDLRICLDILLAHASNVHGFSSVDLHGLDTYWLVSDWLNVSEQPQAVVGSLADDMDELKKLVANPDRASALDLERLGTLLRLLSDQLVAD